MSYDSSNTYATLADLQQRTTDHGYINLADRNGDGLVSSNEQSDVEDCIERANQVVDEAMASHYDDPDSARGQSNAWLRDRCLDIAIYYLATLGSREPSEAQQTLYDDAVDKLKAVRLGKLQVPRLTYPEPTGIVTSQTIGIPRSLKTR